MNKNKKLLIASACVSALGIIVLIALGIYTRFDLKKLNKTPYTEKTYEIEEKFNKISIDTSSYDVKFELAKTSTVTVTCINPGKNDVFAVEKKTLNIISKAQKSKGSLFNPAFDFKDGKTDIVISIPNKTLNSLSIKTSGGKVEIDDYFNVTPVDVTLETNGGTIIYGSGASNVIDVKCAGGSIEMTDSKCTAMNLTLESGEITLNGVGTEADFTADVKDGKLTIDGIECDNFALASKSGNADISNVKSEVRLDVDNGSGTVKLEKSDANIVNIKNDSGSVTASFLTDKIFTTSSNGGKIDIPEPKEDLAGMCVIDTNSGDVKCSIAG